MTISMMLMLVMLLALVAPLQAAASSLPRTTSLPSTTSVASSLADGEGDDVQRAPASAKVRYATKKLNSKCFEVTVRGQAMKNKRIELQYKVFKGKTARTRIENISGASLVNRAVDGRHVTFTLVPRKARFTATVCREKRTTKLPFQGAFMDLDCALKRCKGRASGRGFHGWFFNPQSWAPACGHKTAVENGEVAYYFTGYASLSRSLASAESFQTEPANGVKRWLTVGGANGIAGYVGSSFLSTEARALLFDALGTNARTHERTNVDNQIKGTSIRTEEQIGHSPTHSRILTHAHSLVIARDRDTF